MISKRNNPSRCNHSISTKLARRRNENTQAKVYEHWLDIWLPRISHFSQFGLFVVTLGSLYFVVLPIYKVSVLDEAIARKEIELKESNKLVEQNYKQVRKFAIEQFTHSVFVNCIVDVSFELSEDEKRKPDSLSKDASNCLFESGKTSLRLKLLRPNDQAVFLKGLKNVAAEIEHNRIIAVKQYRELPSKAKLNPSLLKPPKYFSRKSYENLEKLYKALHMDPEAILAKKRFDAGVVSAQLDVRTEHFDLAKQKLVGLINLDWSNSN